MAKDKELDDYEEESNKFIKNITKKENIIVQKSRPLLELYKSDLTIIEFKILDVYLSRINSHNPDHKTVIFGKAELERIFGIKKMNNSELKKRLKHLMSNVVELPDSESGNGFQLVTLFEEAISYKDENGVWKVQLECTDKAMKYFFNIENLGYFRYRLRSTILLKSRYSYVMFNYLESNRFRKTWVASLDEVKLLLKCDKTPAYSEFKDFNRLVLKKIKDEITKKTECRFDYETIKSGRKISAIRFTVETLSDRILRDNNESSQMTFEDYEKKLEEELNRPMWHEEYDRINLKKEEIVELDSLLVTVPDICLPDLDFTDDISFRRYHYLDQKISLILRRDKEKPIRSKFSYLKKLIQNDIDNATA